MPNCTTGLLVAMAVALSVSSAGCGPQDEGDALLTTWTRGVLLSPPYIDYGLSGNPLIGAWRNRLPAMDPAESQEIHSRWLDVVFERDGTWKWIDETIYLAAGAHPSCTQTTTWQGTFTGASPEGHGSLTLSSSAKGILTRKGCLDPAENGAFAADPSPDGVYEFITISPGWHASYGLTLTPPATSKVLAGSSTLARVDVEQATATLAFDADGTFELTEDIDYAADELRQPGCHEHIAQKGSFVEGGTGADPRVTLSAAAPATVTRTNCNAPAANGTTELSPEEALGPLAGEHQYSITPPIEGHHTLAIVFASGELSLETKLSDDVSDP